MCTSKWPVPSPESCVKGEGRGVGGGGEIMVELTWYGLYITLSSVHTSLESCLVICPVQFLCRKHWPPAAWPLSLLLLRRVPGKPYQGIRAWG